MLTGNDNLFQMIPIAFIALITAVDIFKIYQNRPTSEPQSQEETSMPEPPSDEDTTVDLP